MIPELHGAAFASVGEVPEAVLRSVVPLGGGQATVLGVLDEQIELREAGVIASFPKPSDEAGWLFSVEGFDPFREREVETWLTVANGETGTRGSLEEGSPASTPATFVAGVFGDDTGELHIRQPVMAPDWLCLRLLVEGMPLNLMNGEVLEHRRVLDLRQGIVFRYWRQRDRVGRTVRVRTARFASMADRSIMVLRAEASPEDFCGRLVWEACVGVSHAGGPVYEAALESLDGSGFVARTKGRKGGGHALAVSTRPAAGSPVARYLEHSRDVIGGRLDCDEPATIDRIAAVVSSPSRPPAESAAANVLDRAERLGYDELLRRHVAAWRERWDDAACRSAATPRRARAALLDLPHDLDGPPHQGERVGRRPRPVGASRTSCTSSGTPRSSSCPSSSTPTLRRPARCSPTATATWTAPGARRATWGHKGALFPGSRPTRAPRPRPRTASGRTAR